MSNSYFQFKKFVVQQEKCAMKVCTDSCLFGAWSAKFLNKEKIDINRILDIGCGTGLLSLMLAQKVPNATIDAIEIHADAALQAKENVDKSEWKENINIYQSRIQDFNPTKKYDFIISNPPFYKNDLQSVSKAKNAAYHNTELSLQELIASISHLLNENGNFAILLPYHRTDEWQKLATDAGFFLHKKVLVKQTMQHDYFRSMNLYSRTKSESEQAEISIKDNANNYAPEFIQLLRDYYLYL